MTTLIAAAARHCPGISDAEILHLATMLDLAGGADRLTIPLQPLAKAFAKSESRIRQLISRLVSGEYLTVIRQHRATGWHEANTYVFAANILAAWREARQPATTQGGVRRRTGREQERSLETPESVRAVPVSLERVAQKDVSRRCAPLAASSESGTGEQRNARVAGLSAAAVEAEKRAKRKNQIKTLRRWVQWRLRGEELIEHLAFLQSQEDAIRDWDGRSAADKRRYDHLARRVKAEPLPREIARSFWQAERPADPARYRRGTEGAARIHAINSRSRGADLGAMLAGALAEGLAGAGGRARP